MIKNIISKIIVGAGIVAAIYLFGFMFIGGIVAIATALSTSSITFFLVAINVLKILFAPTVTAIIFYGSLLLAISIKN